MFQPCLTGIFAARGVYPAGPPAWQVPGQAGTPAPNSGRPGSEAEGLAQILRHAQGLANMRDVSQDSLRFR